MEKDMRAGGKGLAQWCKAADSAKVVMIQRQDGSYTANATEMHKLLLDAWLPIFRMYDHGDPPKWEEFENKFGQFIPPSVPCQVEVLKSNSLRRILTKMHSGSSAGADGWRVEELKALPPLMLEKLALLLTLIEETGVWPQALCESVVSLILKGEAAHPLKLGPICCV